MAPDLSGHLMSLDQLQLQQLESDEGGVVAHFGPKRLSEKCGVTAFVAILIESGVFWLS